MRTGGGTPTGTAIMKACMLMHDYYSALEGPEDRESDIRTYYV